jgi:hypothetical protein
VPIPAGSTENRPIPDAGAGIVRTLLELFTGFTELHCGWSSFHCHSFSEMTLESL